MNASEEYEIMIGNHAAAYACKGAKVQVVAAYPITPQSPVVEKISYFIESGELNARMVRVESEQSALVACVAASATGVRTYTATSSHGLMLMYEILCWAAGNRLPIVMNIATRAVGAPWSVWTDHQDAFTVRDTGWLQMFCEDNQEIYDTNLQAFRIAEDPCVYVPTLVSYDGYILSHTFMPVRLEPQSRIDDFIPPLKHHLNLGDMNVVKGVCPVTTPHVVKREEGTAPGYYEFRYSLQRAMEHSIEKVVEVHDLFAEKFGRSYGNGIYKAYKMEDADIVIFAVGSVASESRLVIDKLRAKGIKIGLISLKLFRPFPAKHLREVFKDIKTVVVFDRDVGYGYEGILFTELKSALYQLKNRPFIKGYIVGLGGRDVKADDLINGVLRTIELEKKNEYVEQTEFIGLKLDELDFLKKGGKVENGR